MPWSPSGRSCPPGRRPPGRPRSRPPRVLGMNCRRDGRARYAPQVDPRVQRLDPGDRGPPRRSARYQSLRPGCCVLQRMALMVTAELAIGATAQSSRTTSTAPGAAALRIAAGPPSRDPGVARRRSARRSAPAMKASSEPAYLRLPFRLAFRVGLAAPRSSARIGAAAPGCRPALCPRPRCCPSRKNAAGAPSAARSSRTVCMAAASASGEVPRWRPGGSEPACTASVFLDQQAAASSLSRPARWQPRLQRRSQVTAGRGASTRQCPDEMDPAGRRRRRRARRGRGRSRASPASTAATSSPSRARRWATRSVARQSRAPPAATWMHRPERGAVERSTRPTSGPEGSRAARQRARAAARVLPRPRLGLLGAGGRRGSASWCADRGGRPNAPRPPPPPRADRELAQVPQERHRGVVLAGRSWPRTAPPPYARPPPRPGQPSQVAGPRALAASRSRRPRPLPGGEFGLPASPFPGAPFGSLAEFWATAAGLAAPPEGAAAGRVRRGKRRSSSARRCGSPGPGARAARRPLRLRQARDPSAPPPRPGWPPRLGAARRRGREQVAVDAQERDEGLERRAEPAKAGGQGGSASPSSSLPAWTHSSQPR